MVWHDPFKTGRAILGPVLRLIMPARPVTGSCSAGPAGPVGHLYQSATTTGPVRATCRWSCSDSAACLALSASVPVVSGDPQSGTALMAGSDESRARGSLEDAPATASTSGAASTSYALTAGASPDSLQNTPSNIARLEDAIENCAARRKYLARTKSPSDGEDVRWYFCKLPLGDRGAPLLLPPPSRRPSHHPSLPLRYSGPVLTLDVSVSSGAPPV